MAQADVSGSVYSIIAAFTSCRDVLRKLKAHSNKKHKSPGAPEATELRLNQSLRRGPVEIEKQYGKGLQVLGNVFEAGDTCARIELNSILLKLNSGLVDLISNFIKSSERTKVQLDYVGLTALSDASRVQARSSLISLAERLSPPLCDGSATKAAPHDAKSQKKKSRTANAAGKAISRRRHRIIPDGEYYAISKQDSETQIALVRPAPRTKRTVSKDSARSSRSQSSKKRDVCGGNIAISTPRQASPTGKVKSCCTPPMPTTSDRTRTSESVREATTPRLVANRAQPASVQPVETRMAPSPVASGAIQRPATRITEASLTIDPASEPTAVPRRRPVANTETMYTMTSASTKLGEIPMHKWTIPFDFANAERLNALEGTTAWVNSHHQMGYKKPGFMKRLFGRKPPGSGAVVVS